jgi:hypothetical protein
VAVEVEPDRWIEDLRARLAAGDLSGLAPFDLGDGTGRFPGDVTVGIMLADLDHLDGLPTAVLDVLEVPERRDRLMAAFSRLRDLIG